MLLYQKLGSSFLWMLYCLHISFNSHSQQIHLIQSRNKRFNNKTTCKVLQFSNVDYWCLAEKTENSFPWNQVVNIKTAFGMTTSVSYKVPILWKINAVNTILVASWDYVKSFESLVGPYPYIRIVSLFTCSYHFFCMIDLHTDQGVMMFAIMPLSFCLAIINDS